MSLVCINVTTQIFRCIVFFPAVFFSRTENLSSGVDVVHATRQVCCPAEKNAGTKTTRLKKFLVTFMQTRDMYLHFTRSNAWARNGRALIFTFSGTQVGIAEQANLQGGICKGYCHAMRHRALVKVASQAQLLLFFSESAHRLGIGN